MQRRKDTYSHIIIRIPNGDGSSHRSSTCCALGIEVLTSTNDLVETACNTHETAGAQ